MSRAPREVTAQQLAREFDSSFASDAHVAQHERQAVLAIRAGHKHLALRAGEMAGILRCPLLTSMPSRSAAFIGLAGVRGKLVAVHSIAALISEAPSNESRGALLGEARSNESRGWLVLCASDASVGLRFDELEGYLQLDSSQILSAGARPSPVATTQVVTISGHTRPLLQIPQLIESIRQRASVGADKE